MITQAKVDELKSREAALYGAFKISEKATDEARKLWSDANRAYDTALNEMLIELEIQKRMAEKGVAK